MEGGRNEAKTLSNIKQGEKFVSISSVYQTHPTSVVLFSSTSPTLQKCSPNSLLSSSLLPLSSQRYPLTLPPALRSLRPPPSTNATSVHSSAVRLFFSVFFFTLEGGAHAPCFSTNLTGKQIQSPHNAAAQKRASLVGLAVGAIDGMIGLQCSPISAIGALGTGSNWCVQTMFCLGQLSCLIANLTCLFYM